MLTLGSSPHGWGTQMMERLPPAHGRFIPTWVGNTCTIKRSRVSCSVHPHMGGEHDTQSCFLFPNAGSSPHGWGTHLHIDQGHNIQRFIPTWVGNTSGMFCKRGSSAVHPHMGGEHPFFLFSHEGVSGSSPHGWGTLIYIFTHESNPRFIPTWVGNTHIVLGIIQRESVHPHMGGEHSFRRSRPASLTGSSPHGWGTLLVTQSMVSKWRFIPTWVGNTFRSEARSSF